MPEIARKMLAEFIGTFWLVFGGCGAAVFAAGVPDVGIGYVGVAMAFGLTVLTMAYAIGHISGCHLNPAVSLGLLVGGRFSAKDIGPYVVAQIVGGVVAAAALYGMATGAADYDIAANGLATNGYGALDTLGSPQDYSMMSGLIGEIVLTFMFLIIILGATDERAPAGFAPIAIGLGLTLIHLIGIPLTNLSVNPARSIGPALMVQGTALTQLWLFIVAPLVGAALAGVVYRVMAPPAE